MKCADTRKARHGDKVTVHYGGFLQDGECRDSLYLCPTGSSVGTLRTCVLQDGECRDSLYLCPTGSRAGTLRTRLQGVNKLTLGDPYFSQI